MRFLQASVRLRPTMQSRRTSLPWVTKPSSLNDAIVMSSDVGFNTLISGDHRYGFVSLIRIQSNAWMLHTAIDDRHQHYLSNITISALYLQVATGSTIPSASIIHVS